MTQQKQDIFQQTEGKLYWYYEAERELELMRGREERINSNRLKLMCMRSEYIEACAYQGAKAQYCSEHVQGKKSIYSNPIEPAVNAMEDLYSEMDLLWNRQMKLIGDIAKKEEEAATIQMAIGYLCQMDREICEYKYRYHMSLEEIGRNMNLSKGAIRNRREKIVRHVADRLQALHLPDVRPFQILCKPPNRCRIRASVGGFNYGEAENYPRKKRTEKKAAGNVAGCRYQ